MCGFAGMASHADVAPEIHTALQALQHRGQDSGGIATMSDGGTAFHFRRGLGTITQAVSAQDLAELPGTVGVGHVRYPTAGKGVLADTQPFFYRQPGVLMAHNGNITNYDELRSRLSERSIHLMSRCDVEPVLCELSDALVQRRAAGHTTDDVVAALEVVTQRVRGSYTLAATLMVDGQQTLVAFRDPDGIRPGIIGRRPDGAWMFASESVALDTLGFERVCEPEPGQAVFLVAGREPVTRTIARRSPAPCVFEMIYFARPDSVISERSVYDVRLSLGRELAGRIRQRDITADVVVPVPDTARPAAAAVSEQLGLPLREGIIKNRYSGRTFIMADAVSRGAALRLKLNPLPGELKGRRVLLVDDSIVRGTTLDRVVALVREAGATEVHLAIHSPPVMHPCFYGIDMSMDSELFARRFPGTLEELEVQAAEALGADSLTYLDLDGLGRAYPGRRCAACFDGDYPQPVTDDDRAAITRDRQAAR